LTPNKGVETMQRNKPPAVTLHINKDFTSCAKAAGRCAPEHDKCRNHAVSALRMVETLQNSGISVEQFLDSVLSGQVNDARIAVELVEDLLEADHKLKLEKFIMIISEKSTQT
jgi:hypothetical protein